MKNYVQRGRVMPWKNEGSDVASGDVVAVNDVVGVAVADIASGDVGELAISGVFLLPTDSGVTQGQRVHWSGSKFEAGEGGETAVNFAGLAFADEANGEARILLTPSGYVTAGITE